MNLDYLDHGESKSHIKIEKIDNRYGAIARFSHKTTLMCKSNLPGCLLRISSY